MDLSFFGPLKTNWGHVCHDFYQSAPSRVVTKYNFSELFAKAWLKTCTPEVICGGFRRGGIIPFNPGTVIQRFPGSDEGMGVSGDDNQEESSKVTEEAMVVDPTFSSEEEQLFSHRYEEGYDLYDSRYMQWLSVVHPEASMSGSVAGSFLDVEPVTPLVSFTSSPMESPPGSTSSSTSQTPPSTSSSKSASSYQSSSSSSSTPDSSSSSSALVTNTPTDCMSPTLFSSPEAPVPETPPTSSVSPPTKTVGPTANSSSPESLSSSQGRLPLSPIINASPNMSSLSSKSPFSKYLIPIPKDPKSTGKVGRATVLTSNECLSLLEEKKKKKEKEAEEKEERKKEREKRKLEREALQRKKREERLERQRKKQEEAKKKKPVRRGRRKVNNTNPGNSSGAPSIECPSVETETPLQETTCTPESTIPESTIPESTEQEEVCECAFCFGNFCADGEEWLKCACSRWVHERCMEDVHLDENGEERFCPLCLNAVFQ